MKPVRCGEIATGECEGFAEAPQGSQWVWSRISVVFLCVNSQHQLGCLRKTASFYSFCCGGYLDRVRTLTPTEDCVLVANSP